MKFNKCHLLDARNIKEKINDEIVDVTITSPPYFDMKDYGHKNQIGYGQEYDEYLEDLKKVFQNVYDVTKDTGSLWVIIDTFKKNNEIVPLPFDFSNIIKKVGWKLQDIIIWNKNKTVPWSNKGQTKNKFEYILLFSKSKNFKYYRDRVREYNTKFLKKWWVKYPERYNPKGKASEGIWDHDIPTQGSWGNGYIKHFCPLPTDMIGKMILLTSDENDVILDPFAGTGSVLVQAACMKRKYIGFELNENYITMFDNYLEKSLEKGSNDYKVLQNGKYDQEIFATTILNLRALKFAKVLRNKIKGELQDLVELIYVEISEKKPSGKHKIITVNYDIIVDNQNFLECQNPEIISLNEEITNIVSNPPLSGYGIEAYFRYKYNKIYLSNRCANKDLFLYSYNGTHKYIGKFNPKHKISKFTIISPIKVDLNEEDFE
jgi:DNA modification methylase